jgi:hypothetical protein
LNSMWVGWVRRLPPNGPWRHVRAVKDLLSKGGRFRLEGGGAALRSAVLCNTCAMLSQSMPFASCPTALCCAHT